MKKLLCIPLLAVLLLAFSSFDVIIPTPSEDYIGSTKLTEDCITTQEVGTLNQGSAVINFIAEDCKTVAARAGVHAWLDAQIAGYDSRISYIRYRIAYTTALNDCLGISDIDDDLE